jgi:TM2 domain-containing membrane protein YozV
MSDQPAIPPQPTTPAPPPMAPPSAPPPAAPQQATPPQAAWTPGSPSPSGPALGPGKSRVLAIVFALVLGFIGIHKFYLGKMAQGVIYVLFFWTGIPAFIAWIEALIYLTKSNEEWAAQYGGAVEHPSGAAIGCLWILALLPLLSSLAVILLIFLGGAISSVATY